jgi:hypothetical protein
MARPVRKKLKFNEESLDNLLQEIYNDSHNIKAKITRLFTKWEAKVKENGEVAAIGEQIIKLIGAEAKNQDQKIMLLKYLKDVVYEKGRVSTGEEETDELSSEDRNELIQMVQQELDKKKQAKG